MTSTNYDIIVGIIDNLGYLRCMGCLPFAFDKSERVVYVDSKPHAFEHCEVCDKVLNTKATQSFKYWKKHK